jgi:hypothetical protein
MEKYTAFKHAKPIKGQDRVYNRTIGRSLMSYIFSVFHVHPGSARGKQPYQPVSGGTIG